MLAQELRLGSPDDVAENERDEDRVVELAHDRDEVRDEVERQGDVGDRETDKDSAPPGHTPVSEQAREEDEAVGDEPRERPDAPLAPRPRSGRGRGRHSRAGA